MCPVEDGSLARLGIGATLKQTRQRLGLEIREVEATTKIRIKYLRALENEEWDVLPGPAYVRGFLRAYADLLELDGGVLADEYRRQFEAREARSVHGVQSVLGQRRERHRREKRGLSSGQLRVLLGGLGLVAIAVIAILILSGGSSDTPAEQEQLATGATSGVAPTAQPAGDVRLAIVTETELQVCVTDANGDALIDSQLLGAGTREALGKQPRLGLDLGEGQARLIVDGTAQRLDLATPASFEITEAGVEELPFSGHDCP